MDLEKIIKKKLIERGFKSETLTNNRGLIGACIEETIEQLHKNAVMCQREQLFCQCDNPEGIKEMNQGKLNCSKCKKPY